MSNKKLPYRAPKIIRNNSGDWCIGYYYLDPTRPGKWFEKKERRGINHIKHPAAKEIAAQELLTIVENWLKAGNRPYDSELMTAEDISNFKARANHIKKQKASEKNGPSKKQFSSFVSLLAVMVMPTGPLALTRHMSMIWKTG